MTMQIETAQAAGAAGPKTAVHTEGRRGTTRRVFVQTVATGLLVAVASERVRGQARERRGGRGGESGRFVRGGGAVALQARLHIAADGTVTVLCGKVECGQGSRAELAQAAAEELHMHAGNVEMMLCDTQLTPNDGGTYGSQTTPRTIPTIREAAAAAREILIGLACTQWGVPVSEVQARNGAIVHAASKRSISYGALAGNEALVKAFAAVPRNATLTPTARWNVMGTSFARRDAADLVNGRHLYPTDIVRPGMMYGQVLRAPTYTGTLKEVDLTAANGIAGVKAIRDGDFAGVAAPNTALAQQAIDALAPTATWTTAPMPSSDELPTFLRDNARGGIPKNPFADTLASARQQFHQSYYIPYIQHAPLEPRTAVAEWDDAQKKVTIWTGTQNPFSVRGEVARAFSLPEESVRIIVPDFGAAFGGKHTGEAAVEAARLARGASRPVMLRWSREEEFTWAYFRPAGVIDITASLDSAGKITSWHLININSGNAGLQSPYRIAQSRGEWVQSKPPLRHGSYRGLAATANNFARECAMDELATLARQDPVAFRLAHLDNPRLAAVLQEAAKRFGWPAARTTDSAAGIACATEKGSCVSACAEVTLDRANKQFRIQRIVQTFECGAIVNPNGLMSQVQGAIVQGLGAVLREEMRFSGGKMLNASFAEYAPPRFRDVPPIEVHLMDRPDLPSTGAGETPLVIIAAAVANAVSAASGKRIRRLPVEV